MATATKNPVKDAQNGNVRVEIFDQAYNLRGSDPEYILKLADMWTPRCAPSQKPRIRLIPCA